MKDRRARGLAAKAYTTSSTVLAGAALSLLKHHRRRDHVAEGLAAFIKGVGASAYAPYPAPSGFRWDFVTSTSDRVTSGGEPAVALIGA